MMNASPHLQVRCLDGGMEWQWSRLGGQAELLPMDCLFEGFYEFPYCFFLWMGLPVFPIIIEEGLAIIPYL